MCQIWVIADLWAWLWELHSFFCTMHMAAMFCTWRLCFAVSCKYTNIANIVQPGVPATNLLVVFEHLCVCKLYTNGTVEYKAANLYKIYEINEVGYNAGFLYLDIWMLDVFWIVRVIVRDMCSSLIAHLAAVAATRVRFPASCQILYIK